jgi:glycosyltransferase involved in cell wall biosynthesis
VTPASNPQRRDIQAAAVAVGPTVPQPGPVPLTVVIPTLNEGDQIAECLDRLKWVDQIVVADGGSTDATARLAREAGAQVLEGTGPTIAAQRNAAIAEAKNHWILAVDADERVTEALRNEIALVIQTPRHPVYRVRRRNFYLGKELTRGRWGKDWVTRLFTRDLRYIARRVHERLEPVPNPGYLSGCLDHIPYRSLSHQLDKMNRYALWGAQDLYEQGHRASAWDLSLRPAGRFLRSYVLQGACLDGRFGLTTSVLGSYTTFLKYAHLWALEHRL